MQFTQMTKKLVLVSMLALAGCATIVSGSSQIVQVQAIDDTTHNVIPYAKCSVTNAKGVVLPVVGNPGTVNLSREYGSLQTTCVAKGYKQTGVGSGNSFNAWTLVNVLFWPGFIVDAASGATTKYPSHITVLMHK